MRRIQILLLVLFGHTCIAQDMHASRKILNTLSMPLFWGRGYTKDGMQKAAAFIEKEFTVAGLSPMDGKDFNQHFSYPVNTFPGKMAVTINGKPLIPGKDFIIDPMSISKHQTGIKEIKLDSNTFISREQRVIITLQDKLTWGVAKKEENYTAIEVRKDAVKGNPETADLDVENVFIPEFKAVNICGIVRGTEKPDSLLLITAHYDHLGGMGAQTYFPGANDNASGVALLISLARYYAAHPQPYSIGFICFAGEEAGLLGSNYFTRHPLLPLNRIRFLINMDMVGTGEKGITVVNATLHPKEFALLNTINHQKKYLGKINSRGKAANSDHYYFSEKGVPAFFIYTQGGPAAYHDVNDQANTLPLTKFRKLYRLIIKFNTAIMQP